MAFMKPKSVTTESISKEKVVSPIVLSPQTTTQPMLGMDAHVTKSDLLQAEVLWTLKTVSSHQSYRSSDDTDKLFARMFPDSVIAAKFSCAAKKTSYMTVFGIKDQGSADAHNQGLRPVCSSLRWEPEQEVSGKNKWIFMHDSGMRTVKWKLDIWNQCSWVSFDLV